MKVTAVKLAGIGIKNVPIDTTNLLHVEFTVFEQSFSVIGAADGSGIVIRCKDGRLRVSPATDNSVKIEECK